MTDLLRDVLTERAEGASAAGLPVDLDEVLARGRARLRRRRLTVVGTAAAAAVAVALGAAIVPPQLAGDPPVAGTRAALDVRQLAYADGQVIHVGDQVIDTGKNVRSMVLTSRGVVYAGNDGTLWFTDGSTSERIGATSPDGLYVKGDKSGPLAAWVEFPKGQAPEFVVYDTAADKEVTRTSEGNTTGMTSFRDGDAAYVFAVDGTDVYWRSGEGVVRHDTATGRSEVLADEVNPFDVIDVKNGLIAHEVQPTPNDARAPYTLVGRDWEEGVRLPTSGNGYLSPSGRHLALEAADERRIFDTTTGDEVEVRTPGYPFAVVYAWLDDDTAAVVALDSVEDDARIDLLSCKVSTGSCETTVTDASTFDRLTLPVGEELDA